MEVKQGDRVTFQAVCRWGAGAVTRVVVGFNATGYPLVRYGGYSDFVVRLDEIRKVNGEEVSQ